MTLYTTLSPEMAQDIQAFYGITASRLEEELTRFCRQEVKVKVYDWTNSLIARLEHHPDDLIIHVKMNFKAQQAEIYVQPIKINGETSMPSLLFKKKINVDAALGVGKSPKTGKTSVGKKKKKSISKKTRKK